MTFETDSTSLPPYEQLPASRRLSKVLEDRGFKSLVRHVENIIFYLSSTQADNDTIAGIKDLCLTEFNELLVKRRFGILDEDYVLYRAFEMEVDQELTRRSIAKDNEDDRYGSKSKTKSGQRGQDTPKRGSMASESDGPPPFDYGAPTEEATPPYVSVRSLIKPTRGFASASQAKTRERVGRPVISRIAGAAGLGLGSFVLAPVAAAAGIAGAGVKGATMIIGGLGDGLNATFTGGMELVKDRRITTPVVGPVAAAAGIAGGAVSGVALITGGVSKGLFAAFDEGISASGSMMKKARDFARDTPSSP